MNQFRGTKGEWVFDEPSCKVRHKKSFIEIADTYGSYCEYGENTANAKLIAAAPELLEALQAVDDQLRLAWDERRIAWDVVDMKTTQQIKTAINKALGLGTDK